MTHSVIFLSDEKPGHVNQAKGLLDALRTHTKFRVHTRSVKRHDQTCLITPSRLTECEKDPPQSASLLLGVGSRTHVPLLAMKQWYHCPVVVLMSPAACFRPFFDLCIVPEHDGVGGQNVIQTKGVLNGLRPAEKQKPPFGLILVGGPSAHHGWSDASVSEAVRKITEADDRVRWELTTSRRTPKETTLRLLDKQFSNLHTTPFYETDPDWLPQKLAAASYVWVTEDSVSMLYESLSAGCRVGVIPVRRRHKKASRVIRGLEKLLEEEWVFSLNRDSPQMLFEQPPQVLQEAQRVASLVYDQCLLPQEALYCKPEHFSPPGEV